MRLCSKCQSEIWGNKDYCPRCAESDSEGAHDKGWGAKKKPGQEEPNTARDDWLSQSNDQKDGLDMGSPNVCGSCLNELSESYQFCPHCGTRMADEKRESGGATTDEAHTGPDIAGPRGWKQESSSSENNTDRDGDGRPWYESGWVWFWLVLIWPVGVYGLIQRAEPEKRKWWYSGIALVLTLAMFDPDASTDGSPSIRRGNDVENAYIICGAAEETGMLSQECNVSGFNSTVDLYIDTNSREAMKICRGIRDGARSEGLKFGNDWTIRIFSPFSGDRTIAQCSL